MPIEVSTIRRRVQVRLDQIKQASVLRRGRVAEAEQQYATFLDQIALPVFRAVASVLTSEGHAFKLNTPAGGLRLASDRAIHTFVDLRLDTSGDDPQVVAEISRQRGSQVLADDVPLCPGRPVAEITEDEVLDLLVDAIGRMIDR